MGKYLKLFETHSAYSTYINGQDKILPNVSYCENENEVHYNPWTDPRLIAKFNVADASRPTMIYGGMSYEDISVLDYYTKIEVDGVEISLTDLDENYGMYQLSEGEHTIRYTLSDPLEIGHAAFYQCSLTSITIPNSVTSIDTEAFYEAGLTSVTIPNSVTSIGNDAFSDCTFLRSITIGNSVTSIGNGVFTYCNHLTSITVDSGNNAYDSRNDCNAIIETSTNTLIVGCQNTVIPNTVTSIGSRAFIGCTGLTSITIPDSVTSIGQYAFDDCEGLTSVTLSGSVTTIDGYVFYNCSGLTSITIPNGVTSIGQSAFSQCTGLTSITIPNSVTNIGQGAFNGCSGLTSVTIGNSVTSIGISAFYHCSGLTSITSLATTAPSITNNTFRNVNNGGTLTVPSGSTGYDVWMGTGNYYLGTYSWTKVEQ